MNIALFPSAFYPSLGGVEELTRQLAHELTRQGHGVVVITNRWPRDLPERDTINGIEVLRLPMRFPSGSLKSWVNYFASRGFVRRKLAKVLREGKADVLHVQCVSTQAHYALWAKRALGLPMVVTLQGELTMDAARLYQRSVRAQDLMRQTLRSADAITACSKQTLDEAEAFMGEPWRVAATVICNGVRVADFAAATPPPHQRRYVLGIGRHVRQKGFDLLLEAFAQIAPSEKDLDLILAGDGPESDSLRALSERLGLQGRVQFVGRADRAVTTSLFKGCEFFVLPSRHEPFGIVNLEAMAAGKAVVATRVGGVAEVVLDEETGILLRPDDAVELAHVMTRLANDGELRRRLGENGHRRAGGFDWKVIGAAYVKVHKQAVERSGNNRDEVGQAPTARGTTTARPFTIVHTDE